MGHQGIEDALNPRLAGSTEGMTLQVLAQVRDSLTAISRDVRANNEATADVRERVIRLEERDRRLNEIEIDVKTLVSRVDVLMKDKDRRDGASGAFHWLLKWSPTLFGLFTVLFLLSRALGVLHMPDTPAVLPRAPELRSPN